MKMQRLVLVVLFGCLLLLSSCIPAMPSSSPAPETQPTPAPTPTRPEAIPSPSRRPNADEFEVVSLTVAPILVEPGQVVTVEVEAKNIGETEGSYTLTLTVNGMDEETKNVRLLPKTTQIVVFALVKNVSGVYDIGVAGFTDTLRVRNPNAYPRLANYYHIPSRISRSQASALAKWDIIAINCHVARNSPESISLIKELNPNIKILAWASIGNGNFLFREPVMLRDLEESWFLHCEDTPGNPKPLEQRRVDLWTDETGEVKSPAMNPAGEWSTYLPNFIQQELMSSGFFDGVFLDLLWENASIVRRSGIDIDNDGNADSPAVVKREYLDGMTKIAKLTRELLGPKAIIIGNPGVQWSEDSPYWDYANGHMQENALGTDFGSSWPGIWDIYQRNMRKPSPPSRIHWIAADTNNQEFDHTNPDLPPAELQKMRFGLAITLLGDGYFGFDEGDCLHGQLWWFPEYDANLGLAKGDAQERSDGTWIREFENGVVIANPTSKGSNIKFPAIYKDVTTGIEGLQFTVPPQDGRIFRMRD